MQNPILDELVGAFASGQTVAALNFLDHSNKPAPGASVPSAFQIVLKDGATLPAKQLGSMGQDQFAKWQDEATTFMSTTWPIKPE